MLLERMNPWWSIKDWEEVDLDLIKYNQMKIKWMPRWIGEVVLEPFSLNFIYGPRQVGKTTGIKLLIRELFNLGYNPSSILYVNCDLLASFKELRRILSQQKDKAFIFLDEVTGIQYWWKVIKGFIDIGLFKDSIITVSGSSSMKIGKFAEAFVGRRGLGKDIIVLPLSFKEFFDVLHFRKWDLEDAFKKYIETGGFPRSINEDPMFLEELYSSIEKEFVRIGKSYRIGREIMYELLKKAPSPIGYNTIASEIGVSHNTVREYIETMQDMHILGIAYHKEGDKINFRKEKKIFIRDPFLARIFSIITGAELKKDFLYEWIVQEHVYRKYGEIYYWRNKYEVDIIVDDLKIEVKAGKPHRRYPRNVRILEADEIPKFLLNL